MHFFSHFLPRVNGRIVDEGILGAIGGAPGKDKLSCTGRGGGADDAGIRSPATLQTPRRGHSEVADGRFLEVFLFKLAGDSFDDVPPQVQFRGDAGVLVGFVDPGAHHELNDVAVEQQ